MKANSKHLTKILIGFVVAGVTLPALFVAGQSDFLQLLQPAALQYIKYILPEDTIDQSEGDVIFSFDEERTFQHFADKINELQSLHGGSFESNGLTTRDKTTGEYYCIYVDRGGLVTEAGRCNDLDFLDDISKQEDNTDNSGGGGGTNNGEDNNTSTTTPDGSGGEDDTDDNTGTTTPETIDDDDTATTTEEIIDEEDGDDGETPTEDDDNNQDEEDNTDEEPETEGDPEPVEEDEPIEPEEPETVEEIIEDPEPEETVEE